MGKGWDDLGKGASQRLWHKDWVEAAFRVLRPGGVLKAFNGTRTMHHMAMAMEEAGFGEMTFEAWSYGSGFPKSHNIAKAIDKMKGAKREMKRTPHSGEAMMRHGGDNTRPWIEEALKVGYHEAPGDVPVTDEAKLWEGWGTALKPAWEPVIVGTKPS